MALSPAPALPIQLPLPLPIAQPIEPASRLEVLLTPERVWANLTASQQVEIRQLLIAVLQEVLYARDRTGEDYGPPS